ncbi:hypothetical protein RXV95_00790 [Novosphingobium sp. ZN18A2]
MSHAIALLHLPDLPEGSVEGVLRAAVIGFCALALAFAGHSLPF